MKYAMFFLIATALAGACEQPASKDCTDPDLIDSSRACTMEYDPVCGCDGKTYGNACVAKFQHGITRFSKGECDCAYQHSGKVVDKTGLDGCGLMIELENGNLLEPVELPDNHSLTAGSRVEFDYLEQSAASICMAGQVVEITCIREIPSD